MTTPIETQRQADLHKYGVGDYLDAEDYKPNEEVRVKVLDFLGRQEYTARDGTVKRAAMLKVEAEGVGVPQQFRWGIRNEKISARKFGIKEYSELVGRTLLLRVKVYKLGSGFELAGVR